MSWTSGLPSGSQSVRANRSPLQGNFTYIENKMGKIAVGTNPTVGNAVTDHFWATDATLDGHHRFMKMPKFTSTNGASPPDDKNPVLGTSIDGCIYIREVNADVARVEGFYRNTQGIYQFIPSYTITDLASITTSYQTIATLPKNVYGEIFWYKVGGVPERFIHGNFTSGRGFFISNETILDAFAYTYLPQGTNTATTAVKFGNGSDASGLNLRVRAQTAGDIPFPVISGKIRFKITYRALDQDG